MVHSRILDSTLCSKPRNRYWNKLREKRGVKMAELEKKHIPSSEVLSITTFRMPRAAFSTCWEGLDDLAAVSDLVRQTEVHRTSFWGLRPSFRAWVVRSLEAGSILGGDPAYRFLPELLGLLGLLGLPGSPCRACFQAVEGRVGDHQVVCCQQRN